MFGHGILKIIFIEQTCVEAAPVLQYMIDQ